jgi:hypothetical protein
MLILLCLKGIFWRILQIRGGFGLLERRFRNTPDNLRSHCLKKIAAISGYLRLSESDLKIGRFSLLMPKHQRNPVVE